MDLNNLGMRLLAYEFSALFGFNWILSDSIGFFSAFRQTVHSLLF